MGLRFKIDSILYGDSIMESVTLDMFLKAIKDGKTREVNSLIKIAEKSMINSIELYRKMEQLSNDKFIKRSGDYITITSEGIRHLDKGGYSSEIRQLRRSNISFWLSLLAIAISILSALFG